MPKHPTGTGTSIRSRRPYLIRALYQWMVDSGLTPYLLVGVDSEAVQVPANYVTDGKIVLNLAPAAIRDLDIGDSSLSFSGRFGGQPFPVRLPVDNVLAIYAKENGEGMMFGPEGGGTPQPPESPAPDKPHLTVIK